MERDSQTRKVICRLIESANGKRFAKKETHSRIDWGSTEGKRFAKKETNLRIDWWINGISINNFVHVHPLSLPLAYKAKAPLPYERHTTKVFLLRRPLFSSSVALLHSHRRRCAHRVGESRCLRTVALREILLGIAGQSGFWGASLRDCSPRIMSSSPALGSPPPSSSRSTSPPSSSPSSTTPSARGTALRTSSCIDSVRLLRARSTE